MSFVAILIAGAAGFGVGAVWYGVFGKKWMAAVGLTEEEVKANQNPLPFIVAGVAALLAAGMMRHMLASAGVSGFGGGLVAGLGIGAFIVAPWVLIHYAFAGRPKSLWLIDGGHVVCAFTVMGALLGLFL